LFYVVSTSAVGCLERLSLLCVQKDVKHLLTHSFTTGQMSFLSPNQQCQSTKGN